MAINSVEAMLRREEGEVLHVYKDSLGFDTIGVGILVDARKGGGLLPEESAFILNNRISIMRDKLRRRWPWTMKLNEARQAVLIAMAFQMGVDGLAQFANTLNNVEAGFYDKAASGMLRSLWAKQTPARANRMAKQMETGEWQQ
jgi:lysozyme